MLSLLPMLQKQMQGHLAGPAVLSRLTGSWWHSLSVCLSVETARAAFLSPAIPVQQGGVVSHRNQILPTMSCYPGAWVCVYCSLAGWDPAPYLWWPSWPSFRATLSCSHSPGRMELVPRARVTWPWTVSLFLEGLWVQPVSLVKRPRILQLLANLCIWFLHRVSNVKKPNQTLSEQKDASQKWAACPGWVIICLGNLRAGTQRSRPRALARDCRAGLKYQYTALAIGLMWTPIEMLQLYYLKWNSV